MLSRKAEEPLIVVVLTAGLLWFCDTFVLQADTVQTVPVAETQTEHMDEGQAVAAAAPCAECLVLPEGETHVRRVVVSELVFAIPTTDALEHVSRQCAERYVNFRQQQCKHMVGEVRRAQSAMNRILNPIYGRSSPSDVQIKQLQDSEGFWRRQFEACRVKVWS